jgi:5'-3' exonuclease
MGIPAYYRTLCKTIPSLLLKHLDKKPASLWLDFNCIVYHCIRKEGTPAYPGEEDLLVWENQLIRIIVQYCKKLVLECGLKEGSKIFLGIDGVVPMAKMRQQRKRRFKSVWLEEHEQKLGKLQTARWDTNSITPGTYFMERLALSLKENKGWLVSCAEEEGEGEQKIFNLIRKSDVSGGPIVIYGLDADLIVMSLFEQLSQKEDIYLFREHTEFGQEYSKEEYRFLNIRGLSTYISKHSSDPKAYISDYCASMMLLGNDFIPHSIWFTIKDGGHGLLEELISKLKEPLTRDCVWNKPQLIELVRELAYREEESLTSWIYKKFQQDVRHSRDAVTEVEQALHRWNQTPISLKDEVRLLKSYNDDGVVLASCWRENYYAAYLGAHTRADIEERCRVYCSGLQWSLSYMTGGHDVSMTWMYAWSYPPLWEDICAYLVREDALISPPINDIKIEPQEQLSMVLPLASWHLIRNPSLRKLPYIMPHMWNFRMTFCTAGKRMMWECDPHVPLITPERLRFLLNKAINSQIRWDRLPHKDLILRMSESITTS